MVHFDINSFDDRLGRIWFHPDKFALSVAELDVTVELFECSAVGSSAAGGHLFVETLPFNCTASGTFGSQQLTATLAAEMLPVEAAWVSFSTRFTATFTEPTALFVPGASMTAEFVEPHLFMGNVQHLEGELRMFTFTGYSAYRSKDMNCTFKELEIFSLGDNSYTYVDAQIEKLSFVASIGNGAELEFELLEGGFSGVNGVVGTITGQSRAFAGEFTTYTPTQFRLELQQMAMAAAAANPISAQLIMQASPLAAELEGTAPYVGSLSVRMPQLTAQLQSGSQSPVGSLSLVLRAPTLAAIGLPARLASLDAELERITLLASLPVEETAELDLTFPAPVLTSVDGQMTCTMTDILMYDPETI